MRYSSDKSINETVRQLLKAGWRIKSNNRHLRLEHETTHRLITVPQSPSDRRAALNWRSQIRKLGAMV